MWSRVCERASCSMGRGTLNKTWTNTPFFLWFYKFPLSPKRYLKPNILAYTALLEKKKKVHLHSPVRSLPSYWYREHVRQLIHEKSGLRTCYFTCTGTHRSQNGAYLRITQIHLLHCKMVTITYVHSKKKKKRYNFTFYCGRPDDRICCSHANHTSVWELDLTTGWYPVFYTLFTRTFEKRDKILLFIEIKITLFFHAGTKKCPATQLCHAGKDKPRAKLTEEISCNTCH